MLTQINHADKPKVQLAILQGLKCLNIEETDLQFDGIKYTLIRTAVSKLTLVMYQNIQQKFMCWKYFTHGELDV